LRPSAALPCFALSALWAAPAAAQVAVEWQVSGSATVGVTNNVANSPEPPEDDPDAVEPQSDGFGTLSPAFEVILETRDAVQSLGWVFGYTFYFVHPEANNFTNSLTYGLSAPVSDTTTITMSIFGAQANVATFNLASSAATTPVTGTEGGNDLIFTTGAALGFSSEVAETLVYSMAVAGQYAHTIVDAPETSPGEDLKTYVASGHMGLTKELVLDSVTTDVGTEVQITPETITETGTDPLRTEVVHRGTVVWMHEWELAWRTQLGGGASLAYDASADDIDVLPHPVGRAAILYASELAEASIAYDHEVQPNLLLRQLTVTDTISAQGFVPIPRSWFDVGGTVAYQASRSFLPDDGFGPPGGHTIILDAAVGFIPEKAFVRLEARYQYNRQFEGEPDETGNILLPDLQRHAAMLTATFGYPDPPVEGSAAPFVSVPPAIVNPDLMQQNAPATERGQFEEQRDAERDRREDRERRGGSGSGGGGGE
jgi:hypothetical protein